MSALSEIVSLTITSNNVGIARAGFGVPLILSVNASFPERVQYYSDLAGLAEDGFATDSPEYLAATALLSQSPHVEQFAIGRAIGQPTQRYQINVSSVLTGYVYSLNVAGEGVTATTVSYTALADLTVSAVTNGADSLTVVAHGMSTGDGPYRISTSGGLPTGLAVDTDYWVIKLTADTFSLASSKANALATTAINITTDGTGVQTIRRAQNDVICAQLVQGLNAVVGKNFTASQTTGAGETDYVVVTANAAGKWFSVEVTSTKLLKIAQTHAEPGTTLADDLNEIQLENGDWYCLITLYNSEAYVKAAAAWCQAQVKIYIADLGDSETVTLATAGTGSSDAADDLHTLGYSRTAVAYHPSPAAMFAAGWAGTCLPLEPGSETWKFKIPSGVPAVTTTDTHRVNLRAKKANTLTVVAGQKITWEGTTTDGGFIDNRRGLDWLEDDMSKGVFGALVNARKIPFTNAGIALIENEVRASLDRAVARGIIDADYTVTVPKVTGISTSNRALRICPDIKFTARLAGAIHKVVIQGVVSV